MKNPVALLGLLALLLYGVSFAFPDHWWYGPVSRDVHAAPTEWQSVMRYTAPLMFGAFQESLRADRLDWAGWVAHGLQWLAFLLLVLRCDRMAFTAAGVALIFALVRFSSCMPNDFLTGYHLWLASLVVLGSAAFWGFRIARRRELGKWGRRLRNLTAQLAVVAGVGFVIWFLTCTGPRNLASYPDPATSPYRLPFPAGTTRLCSQGNWAVVSHRSMNGGSVYAFDFAMREGSDIVAARAGRVARVIVTEDGFGAKNCNEVLIDHGDGHYSCYMHVMKGGSYVQQNQRVQQGQLIAASGNTGTSSGPHLHFMVLRRLESGAWDPVPISFADVPTDQGVPRMFKWYTSKNGAEAAP